MTKFLAAVGVMLCVACGGGEDGPAPAPSAPTQPSSPQPPSSPVDTWSVAGTLVDTVGRQPVSGASIAPSWELASTTTSASGAFQLGAIANPPTTPYKLTVS